MPEMRLLAALAGTYMGTVRSIVWETGLCSSCESLSMHQCPQSAWPHAQVYLTISLASCTHGWLY